MTKNKLRVSFSLLDAWSRGEHERAIANYLHKDYPSTPQMDEGKKWHEENAKQIAENKMTLKEFGSLKFKKPSVELELEAPYNELFIVKGTIDTLDGEDLWEYKTGKRSATSYLSSMQLSFYAMLCTLRELPIKRLNVMKYNQYEDKWSWAFKWYSPLVVDEARNFVDSLTPEIYDYFDKHNIL